MKPLVKADTLHFSLILIVSLQIHCGGVKAKNAKNYISFRSLWTYLKPSILLLQALLLMSSKWTRLLELEENVTKYSRNVRLKNFIWIYLEAIKILRVEHRGIFWNSFHSFLDTGKISCRHKQTIKDKQNSAKGFTCSGCFAVHTCESVKTVAGEQSVTVHACGRGVGRNRSPSKKCCLNTKTAINELPNNKKHFIPKVWAILL